MYLSLIDDHSFFFLSFYVSPLDVFGFAVSLGSYGLTYYYLTYFNLVSCRPTNFDIGALVA